MTTYRVERMTDENYCMMMDGSYGYHSEELEVKANSKEEANEKARKNGYVVMDNWTKSLEEIEAEDARIEAYMKKEEEKREKAKAKRKATEERKAAEVGMTVEEYRKEKARQKRIERLKNEIEELKKELENKNAELERLTK